MTDACDTQRGAAVRFRREGLVGLAVYLGTLGAWAAITRRMPRERWWPPNADVWLTFPAAALVYCIAMPDDRSPLVFSARWKAAILGVAAAVGTALIAIQRTRVDGWALLGFAVVAALLAVTVPYIEAGTAAAVRRLRRGADVGQRAKRRGAETDQRDNSNQT